MLTSQLTPDLQEDAPDHLPGEGGDLAEVGAGVRGPEVVDAQAPVGGVRKEEGDAVVQGVRGVAQRQEVGVAVRGIAVHPGNLEGRQQSLYKW